jgi:8-oxo-dGTP pyrophosphatase MutT (NUDIX family)
VETRLTATALIERDSKYLLVEEFAQGKIVLNQPSGRWHEGETFAEAAAREAAEEAGVVFVPEFFLGSYITLHTALDGRDICTVRFAYGGRLDPGQPSTPRDRSIISIHWLSYDQILDQKARLRSSAVLRCIQAYRSGSTYPLDTVSVVRDS